jgi:DNA-directed RNA polymerase subunit RPC12/RpoP
VSADFDDSYRCPDCGRAGAPRSDEASSDEFARGWHVTCPDCGFSISGASKAMVLRAVSVLAAWAGRVDALLGTEGRAP